jgi:uncharacterized protein YukE
MSGSNAAENDALGPETLPPGTVSQPELQAQINALTKERDEWRSRATGWQGTFQREQDKWKADSTKVTDLSNQIAKLVEERDAKARLVDETSGSYSLLETEYEIAKHQLERTQILIKEYPDLLQFEADGLLPDGTGDEFKTKLGKFKEVLANSGKGRAAAVLSGGSPTPPGGSTPQSSDDLWKAAKDALRQGKTAEYEDLYSKYLAEKSRKE